MKNKTFSGNCSAVSEVVGAVILVCIAVGAFGAIYLQVFPVQLPSPEPHIIIKGDVADDGRVFLEHVGGEQLNSYYIIVDQSGGVHNRTVENIPWAIGECRYPQVNTTLFNEEKQVKVSVYGIFKDGSTQCVFDGIITPKEHPLGPTVQPLLDRMLLSTLRTNTVDEDLICYSYTIHPNIVPITFIYNWSVATTGLFTPLTRVLLPFDRNNPFQTKDYSGNHNNGTLNGATWTSQGKLGGAYQFNGNSYIAIPYCFTNNKISTITIEVWIKTNQNSGTILSYNRSNYCELAIANGHVKWSTNSSDGIKDLNGTILINDNTWHLIATTYNSASGACSIYIDGRLDTTQHTHTINKQLGSGNSPPGAVGQATGIASRKTIFSTSFETRDETYKWNEDVSGAEGITEAVDNDVSNVDGVADQGTETNFANAQGTTRDGNIMTLQENNYGLPAVNEHLYVDGITNTSTGWTFHGPTPALNSIGGGYITTSTNSAVRRWFTFQNTASTVDSLTVSLSVYVTAGDGNDDLQWRIDTNGDNTAEYTGTINNPTGSRWWNTGTISGLTTGALVNSSRVSFTYVSSGTANTMTIDAAQLNVTRALNPNYKIDFEYQWTTAVYNTLNKQVCLYVNSHTGTENLLVNYWTGSAWSSLETITGAGWANVTATGLTSSTYTIQLKGAIESSDSSQDTWTIDAIFLHLWTTQRTFDILPSTALTPHIGSYSLGGSGDFYPQYTIYNRTAINISGYKSVQVSIWYSYKNTESNDFFGLYYKNNSQWNPIFEITNPTQSGQKPWTQVIVNIPLTFNKIILRFKWRTTSTTEYMAIDDLNVTGIPQAAQNNFTGIIDEVKIYPRVLSPEQLYQNYLCTKDGNTTRSVLVSEELCVGDSWKCLVTPNDGLNDDLPTESNILNIINYGGGG